MEFDWVQIREWLLIGGGLALLIRAFTDVRGQDRASATSVMQTTAAQSGAFTTSVLDRLAAVEEQLAHTRDQLDREIGARYQLVEEFNQYRTGARTYAADLRAQIRAGSDPGDSPVEPPPGFTL